MSIRYGMLFLSLFSILLDSYGKETVEDIRVELLSECDSTFDGMSVSFGDTIALDDSGKYNLVVFISNWGKRERFLCTDVEDSIELQTYKEGEWTGSGGGSRVAIPENYYLYKKMYAVPESRRDLDEKIIGSLDTYRFSIEIHEQIINEYDGFELKMVMNGYDISSMCEFKASGKFICKMMKRDTDKGVISIRIDRVKTQERDE